MMYVGLDPGSSSGAWAVIGHAGQFVACGDISCPNGRVDARVLKYAILKHVGPADAAMIVIEDVHSMPKQGVASTGKFMRAAGAIEATAALLGFEFELVTPQKWKKYHGLIGLPKTASLDLARAWYPNAAEPLKRQKDHGRADAILMALWLREQYE